MAELRIHIRKAHSNSLRNFLTFYCCHFVPSSPLQKSRLFVKEAAILNDNSLNLDVFYFVMLWLQASKAEAVCLRSLPHRTTFENAPQEDLFCVAMLRYVSCFPSCHRGFFNFE